MTHWVTLARPLPLPQVMAGGRPVRFLPVESTAQVPPGTLVHCVTSLDRLDARAIAALPASVRLIANIGVGTDAIDHAAARARTIALANTPVVTEDTADLAFALILAACRRLGEGARFLRAGHWTDAGAGPPLSARVHGRSLGLIGFGAIGQAVARRAQGFAMPVRYWNRTRRPEAETATAAGFEPDLAKLVETSDILSIHAALTPQTRGLVDARLLAAARPGAVLVNTARGGIVDEGALCDALDSGRIGAAGLDVFDGEPRINPRLLAHPAVVLTPHIGSATVECRQDMAQRLLANVVTFLETGAPLDPVAAETP